MIHLIVHLVLLGLIYWLWRSMKKDASIAKEQARFEFDHIDAGGVVRYPSFGEMERMKKRWAAAGLRAALKTIPLTILVVLELLNLALSASR